MVLATRSRVRRPPDPPLRAFERKVRTHALSILCIISLVAGAGVLVHYSRLDQRVSTQSEMAVLASAIQQFRPTTGQLLTERMANLLGLVPDSLSDDEPFSAKPLRNAWGGEVFIRPVPGRVRYYDLTYTDIPEDACLPLLEWATGMPLFTQVFLNRIVVHDPQAFDGVTVPFDRPLAVHRCAGPAHVITVRIQGHSRFSKAPVP